MNTQWLEKEMEARGISYWKLKTEFHISHDTLKSWKTGTPARPFTLRKLAAALGMDYTTLRQNLGVTVLTMTRRRVRVLKAEEAKGILSRAKRIGRVFPAALQETLEKAAKSKR